MPRALIDADTNFTTDAALAGRTTLACQLVRVGGMPYATATLRLLDGRRMTADVANAELAQILATRLYHIISVEGDAKWTADWTLIDFKITSIAEYDDAESITVALDSLSEISAGYWDDIDPDEYVAHLRAESD
jgi:hypothetical protein